MKFIVTIEPDPESGGFVAACPQLPGCWSEGDSRDEALANIKLAIIAVMTVRREEGLPDPTEPIAVDVDVEDVVPVL